MVLLAPLLIQVLHLHPGSAFLVNRTIDDKFGDSISQVTPLYLPSNVRWDQGNTCLGCLINHTFVDVSRAFDGTWHDSTYSGIGYPEHFLTFNFTGTAVYVYYLLANTVPKTTTLTNLSFHIDGALVGLFKHEPDSSSDILYHVLVYANASIPNAEHVMEIRAGGTDASLMLFDFVEYTTEEEGPAAPITQDPPSHSFSTSDVASHTPSLSGALATSTAFSSKPTAPHGRVVNVGAITWGLGGALVALSAGVGLTTYASRRRRRSAPRADRRSRSGSSPPSTPNPQQQRSASPPQQIDLFADEDGFSTGTRSSAYLSSWAASSGYRVTLSAAMTDNTAALAMHLQALEARVRALWPGGDLGAAPGVSEPASLRSAVAGRSRHRAEVGASRVDGGELESAGEGEGSWAAWAESGVAAGSLGDGDTGTSVEVWALMIEMERLRVGLERVRQERFGEEELPTYEEAWRGVNRGVTGL